MAMTAIVIRSFVLTLLPAALVALVCLPFFSPALVATACLLAYGIVAFTELPVHLATRDNDIIKTFKWRLVAMSLRIMIAVGFVLLAGSLYTETFILIFCLTLSLTIIFDALVMMRRSQEPVHA